MNALDGFVQEHVDRIRPLEKDAALAWWDAATTGSPEAYKRGADLQSRIEAMLADGDRFAVLERLKKAEPPDDPLRRRLLDVLHLTYLGRQCSPDLLREIVELSSDLEQVFATFRAEVDGLRLTQNDIERVLAHSTDSAERRRVWEAGKSVGVKVADGVRRLAGLRNRAAAELGFSDYYRMSLTLAEQSPDEIAATFDELERRTEEPFRRVKDEIDAELAERFEIAAARLQPWHYSDPFFQDVPQPSDLGLDERFARRELLPLAVEFFRGIGLDVEGILARSDVEEREGKNQHAFCIDIDREGDVRALLNVKPTARWMSTVLHELGHGVYDTGVRRDLPYVLRVPAHIFTTEGVAMFFGRMPYTHSWLETMGLTDGDDAGMARLLREHQARRQLVFSRWCQVVVRFERALYADPTADLQELWWRLVERYQGIRRPEGREREDWAAKVHIVSSPVYYHNYALGELFASQLLGAVQSHLGLTGGDEGAVAGRDAVGPFLRERVFASGASMPWARYVEEATGKRLSADDFVRQYAG